MAFCAALVSLQYYISYESDLQYSLMEIGQQRQKLAYQSSALAMSAASDPEVILADNPTYQALAWRDKQYEQQQKMLETQLSVASSQRESLQKLVDDKAKNDMKINFGGS